MAKSLDVLLGIIAMGGELVLIVFGWLLGLLAPIITAVVLNSRKTDALKEGIRNELVELQYRAILSTYVFHKDHGKFDHELLRWVKEHISKYQGINKKDGIKKLINMEMELTEDALKIFIQSQH